MTEHVLFPIVPASTEAAPDERRAGTPDRGLHPAPDERRAAPKPAGDPLGGWAGTPDRGLHSSWVIQCDFDGTISVDDVTDSLLNRFGRDGWVALEEAWERGDIGSRECMKGQIALLDMNEAELVEHLDGMAIDPHFVAFVQAARQRGIEVQVISDGLDRAISHILQRHGLGDLPVFANRLQPGGERRWTLQSPHADARCVRASGNCKCARAAEQQSASRQVLYIGDGSSDFCVSGRVDMVLAKSSLIGHCCSRGIAHRPFTDFAEAHELMLALTAAETARTAEVML